MPDRPPSNRSTAPASENLWGVVAFLAVTVVLAVLFAVAVAPYA